MIFVDSPIPIWLKYVFLLVGASRTQFWSDFRKMKFFYKTGCFRRSPQNWFLEAPTRRNTYLNHIGIGESISVAFGGPKNRDFLDPQTLPRETQNLVWFLFAEFASIDLGHRDRRYWSQVFHGGHLGRLGVPRFRWESSNWRRSRKHGIPSPLLFKPVFQQPNMKFRCLWALISSGPISSPHILFAFQPMCFHISAEHHLPTLMRAWHWV